MLWNDLHRKLLGALATVLVSHFKAQRVGADRADSQRHFLCCAWRRLSCPTPLVKQCIVAVELVSPRAVDRAGIAKAGPYIELLTNSNWRHCLQRQGRSWCDVGNGC